MIPREELSCELGCIVPAAPYKEQLAHKQALEDAGFDILGFMRVFTD